MYSETRDISKFRLVQKDQILSVLVPAFFFFHKYPLEGHIGLEYYIWIQIVDILHKTPRSDQREIKIEALINELVNLSK